MATPTSILHAARGKAIRSYRSLCACRNATTAYTAAAIKSAEYWGTAMGTVDGIGSPDTVTVLSQATSAVSSAAALLLPNELIPDAESLDYSNLHAYYVSSSITSELVGRSGYVANLDPAVQLQMARVAKRFTPAHEHTVFMDTLKADDLWPVIRFALLYYHALERIGMHRALVDEITSMTTAAQAEDDFSVYAPLLLLASDLDLANFIPASSSSFITPEVWALADAVQSAYSPTAAKGMRAYRYSMTGPLPPLHVPPTPPSSVIC